MKTGRKGWGFDTETIDESARPQDDFFRYANGRWLNTTKLPNDESRWGSFVILRHKTELELKAIVSDLLRKKRLASGSEGQLVRDIYRAALDMKARNARGTAPLEAWRKRIRDIASRDDLLAYIAESHRAGISGAWNFYIDQDSKRSDRYLLHFYQGGLGLPDRDYYLGSNAEQVRIRKAYVRHIEKLLALAGASEAEAVRARATIIRFETALAKACMKKEDARDVDKTYHKYRLSAFEKDAPIGWKRYLPLAGLPVVSEVIVAQPKFFKAVSGMLSRVPLNEWQTYLEWQLINDSAGLLSQPFVDENFDFYARTLTGTKEMRAPWRRALSAVNGSVSEALGKLYVERYFSADARRRMDRLVSGLFDAYEARIRALDWMGPSTKKKAVKKLRQMTRKIGYPSHWKGYRGLSIEADDHFGNMMRAHTFGHRREVKKLGKPVDRKEWFMSPQTVNAYCSFSMNEIVFPAAILQAPFFSPTADDAVNYAAIGATIGHEMTHGFDDQGSKFDGSGNMKSWWTAADRKRFEKKAELIRKQFDLYEAAPGVNVNGKLTLGENIADLGGLSIAYDAYQKHLVKTGRKNIDGFTPEERFFLGFAQAEREIAREEFLKMIALVDPHSPAPFRVNGPLSNFEPFYQTFGVKEGDVLYRTSRERAKVW